MNWDAIGISAEVVGAIAVVTTLFYLARQIREGNAYSRANTVHETNALYIQVFAPIAQDRELAEIYGRAMDGENLDRTDGIRFAMFANTFMAWLEDAYFQTRSEYVLEEYVRDTEHFFDIFGQYMRRILSVEASRIWWQEDAPHLFSVEFVEHVNRIIAVTQEDQIVSGTPPNRPFGND
jgi:hypothetical protein